MNPKRRPSTAKSFPKTASISKANRKPPIMPFASVPSRNSTPRPRNAASTSTPIQVPLISYALYKGKDLYYVGLAKNLRSRLHGHLKDRHAEAWDRFSVYLTQGDEHLKELESLVLRIAAPTGNRVAGKFIGARDLLSVFRQRITSSQKRELAAITSSEPPRISKDRSVRRKRGEYDTIVCPAHQDGFKKEFLGKNRWYAIRISKSVIPRLKYVALYITAPTSKITHYGRIRAIKPWRDSGKYIVLLRE